MQQGIQLTPETVADLIQKGESATLEFKRSLPPESEVAALVSAFANDAGGIVLLGVGDGGQLLGVEPELLEPAVTTLRRVSTSLLPARAEVGQVAINGKHVVYLRAEPAPDYLRPVLTAGGRAYERRGPTTISLDFGTSSQALAVRSPGEFLAPDVRPGLFENTNLRMPTASVFIAMSFREEEEPALVDYFRAMKRAAELTQLPLVIRRVDLIEGDYEISQKIMEEIDNADIVVADFTLNSSNVYFELGYARGKGRRVIQTARKGTPLQFDIQHWRTLFYRNATELEERLVDELRRAWTDEAARKAKTLELSVAR